jgi:uncharacterized protein YicC (UPF0701 family)
LLDIARGDAARSHQLRGSLKILRDRADNPEFRKLLDDVLAGKKGMRDAARSPLFDQAVTPRVQQAVERLNQMSDEEKQRLGEEGERQLDQLRHQLSEQKSPIPTHPQRRDQPAGDDEDFGDSGIVRDSSW